jgi:glucosyl-3-phosphoglycerate synthase
LIRSFHHAEFPLELLRERKRAPVTVILPAREVADTIGPTVERLLALGDLIDQLLVVDAASEDGSGERAARLGAEVVQEAELLVEFGPVSGKGDAMWRGLSAARGELVVFLDSDTRDFSAHFATGLLGPLVLHEDVSFVKAFYRRPFTTPDGRTLPSGGGRVTELMARPLLSAFYPDLAGFAQPLAGELAARRELLVQLPFATGYAVETAMLLNARDLLGGTEAMAQVDLDERLNQHQPLAELGPMAYGVLGVVLDRLRSEGRLSEEHTPPLQIADGRLVEAALVERPPLQSVGSRA